MQPSAILVRKDLLRNESFIKEKIFHSNVLDSIFIFPRFHVVLHYYDFFK